MQGQVEAGTLCPTTMTFAAVPLLQREPAGVVDFGGDWLPALYSREFDGGRAPAKRGALIGMGLTEKQGGSDLRAISTRATPLARAAAPISWWATNGSIRCRRPMRTWCWPRPTRGPAASSCRAGYRAGRNAVRVRRLKDKLGNRSNASAEVEFEDAWGVMGASRAAPVGAAGNGRHHAARLRWAARRCCARRWCRPRITRVIARLRRAWPSSR